MIARRALLLLATLLVAIVAATDSVAQPACTITWDGGASTSSWHDAANWSTDVVPGATDHVCIPASTTVEVSQDAGSVLTVQSQGTLSITGGSLSLTDTTEPSTTPNLTQSGGTLGGTGTLTLTGTFEWSGGTQADAGTTVIASTGTASLSGGSFKILGAGRTLQVDSGATATMDAAVQLFLDGDALLDNAGTFNANGDQANAAGIYANAGTNQLVHNTGTFTRSGSGAFTVTVPFDNDGTVTASAGTLRLSGSDAGNTSGTFSGTGTDGLVDFNTGTYTLTTGAGLSGRIELTGATLNVDAAVSHSGGTLTQSGGTLGGTGTLTLTGTFEWSGGTQADAGTTVIASTGTASLSGGSFKILGAGRTLQVDSGATATMDAAVQLFLDGDALLDNAGTFNANGDQANAAGIYANAGTNQLVHNTGTFTRSGSGAFTVTVPFDNDGTVTASAGTLRLSGGGGGGTGTGSFTPAAGTVIEFGGGTFDLSGATTSGAGTVRIAAGTVNFAGSYNVGGSTEITGGTANFNSGGTANNLTQSAGTLGGTGTLTLTGTFEWSGGTQADAGTTVIASTGTASLSGGSFKILGAGRTLQVDSGATATMDAAVQLFLDGDALLDNAGTFNANGDQANAAGIYANAGTNQLVHNTGTFTRSGSGAFTVTVPFDNDGTVTASAGTLRLSGSDAGNTSGTFSGTGTDGLVDFNTGTYTLTTGAGLSGRIELTGATLNVDAAVSHSGGTLTQSGGTLGGTGTLTLTGTFEWSGGTQADAGTTVIASTGTASLSGGSFKILGAGRTLQVDSGATATMDAAVQLFLDGDALLDNAGTFNANGDQANAAGIYANAGTNQLVHNTGTFTRSGSGAFTVNVAFDNDGTVEISTGTLNLSTYTQTAGATLHVHVGGLTPGTGFGQLNVAGTATLAGTLRITTESGFTPTLGQSFRIVNANPRSGEFAAVEGSGVPYTVQYDDLGATLVVGDTVNPQATIDNVTVTEGDSATTDATFTVTLDRAATGTATLNYATADNTATAPGDYTSTSGTLTFPEGTTTQTITVPVVGDTDPEDTETFFVNLSAPSPNITIADAQGVGTILDDDEVPATTLSISPESAVNVIDNQHCLSAEQRDAGGLPTNRPVRYAVTAGPNVGATFTDNCYTGQLAGTDTISAYVDNDADNVQDADEPTDTATKRWLSGSPIFTLTPASAENPLGAPHVFTARLTTPEGEPLGAGYTIDVRVPFGNFFPCQEGTGLIVTNEAGVATCTYTSNTPGTDTLVATVQNPPGGSGTLRAEATKTWVAVNPATTLSISPESAVNVIDNQHCLSAEQRDAGGLPTNRPVRYAVTAGPNVGATFTDNCYTGQLAGTDTISAYVDNDADNVQDADEPTDTATKRWLSGSPIFTLTPASAENPLGAPHVFTARLTTPEGEPLGAGYTIDVRVPFGNFFPCQEGTGLIVTNEAGVATCTYTSNTPGTDTLVATVQNPPGGSGTLRAEATKTWVAVNPATTLSISPESAVNVIDNQHCLSAEQRDAGGLPTNRPVRYAVTAGPNVGATFTDNCYTGQLAGTDTISAYVDNDADNVQDADEPTDTATKRWLSGSPIFTLTPASAENPLGAPHVFTARLTTPEGEPLGAGYTIDVRVPFGNFFPCQEGTGLIVTNEAGVATCTYTSNTPGTDTLVATVQNPPGGSGLLRAEATKTWVRDTPEPPALAINNASVTEGNPPGTTPATFTVSLSRASDTTVTVDYATADDSATAPSDYTSTSGTLTFAAGETSKELTVDVARDTTVESDETYFVNLTNASGATIADAQGVGTILDDDEVPAATIDNVTVTEGDSGTTDATFTVTLSGAASGTATLNYATANGSATEPGDYTATSGTLTFAEGVTTQTITVPVVGDTDFEGDESFVVNLSAPSTNISILDNQGVGTIDDDDPVVPAATIDNVSVTEGDTGTTDATFTVTLSGAATGIATLNYATANGSATEPGDYTATSGTLTFTEGELTKTITVPVVGDTDAEPTEQFFVNLTAPSANITIADDQGVGTITNDGDQPTPASVTLSPTSATNQVGTGHCVTATVRDDSSNTMSGVTVRFSVSGANSPSGAETTAANGEARFCYTGTNPGDDTIRAFADSDGNGTQDPDEPVADPATKRWTEQPPAGTPGCEVEGDGSIKAANGAKASFSIDVESGPPPAGKLRFKDHGSGKIELKSTAITQVLVSADGHAATIVGQARIKHGASVEFRIDVQDLASAPDTFRIQFGDYDSGERTIRDGDVDIECKCEAKGAGDIKAANADKARFSVDVNSIPATGRVYYKDRGPAQSFELRSTEISQVTIGPDTTQVTILGKAKLKGAGPFDFRVDATDVPRAPDSFRIRVNDYDSGEQQILSGDLDIDCGDGDHDGKDDKKGKK